MHGSPHAPIVVKLRLQRAILKAQLGILCLECCHVALLQRDLSKGVAEDEGQRWT